MCKRRKSSLLHLALKPQLGACSKTRAAALKQLLNRRAMAVLPQSSAITTHPVSQGGHRQFPHAHQAPQAGRARLRARKLSSRVFSDFHFRSELILLYLPNAAPADFFSGPFRLFRFALRKWRRPRRLKTTKAI